MIAADTVRRRGKRLGHRALFQATVTLGPAVDEAEVKLRRGAHKITTDCEGATISATYEPSARVWAEIGDRLLLAPVDLESDSIAVVEVTRVYPDGSTLEVFRTCGELAPGDVFIMRGPKPRDSRPVIRRGVVGFPCGTENSKITSGCPEKPDAGQVSTRVAAGIAKRPGAAIAELVRAKRLALVEERTKSPTCGDAGDLNTAKFPASGNAGNLNQSEAVRARRLKITNKLGVLTHQAKTSTERGGGCQ